ncbi:MAG: CarD family transcriptional regulator, partial [Pseudoxanthomonas sp.]
MMRVCRPHWITRRGCCGQARGYPKHGVGRVIELQRQEIAGMQLELYVLRFEKERMTLRVPTNK